MRLQVIPSYPPTGDPVGSETLSERSTITNARKKASTIIAVCFALLVASTAYALLKVRRPHRSLLPEGEQDTLFYVL